MNKKNNSRDEYYEHTRKDLLSLLPDSLLISKSLDVGCGAGKVSKTLKECFSVETTIGIEKNPDIAKRAKQNIDLVYNCAVEHPPNFSANEFDLIIFADILEHLVDPWQILQQYCKWLKPEGKILISLPNAQNWKLLLKMAAGNWEYQPSGLLDREHIRFFTAKTAKRMMDNAGLNLLKMQRTMGTEFKLINALTFGIFRGWWTYHLYCLAQKKNNS